MKDLIGKEIEVFVGDTVKKIIVKDVHQFGDEWAFTDEEGNLYSDQDVNWTYKITPEAALWMVLKDRLDSSLVFDYSMYHEIFEEFMESLERAGYVKKGEEG